MLGHKAKLRAVDHIGKRMVTARGGKYDPGAPLRRLAKHDIGGNIAGVQGHNKVRQSPVGAVILPYVPADKFKPVKAKTRGGLFAVFDHISGLRSTPVMLTFLPRRTAK